MWSSVNPKHALNIYAVKPKIQVKYTRINVKMTLQRSRNITVVTFILVYLTSNLGFYEMTCCRIYCILYINSTLPALLSL